jgi:hypothetical protein
MKAKLLFMLRKAEKVFREDYSDTIKLSIIDPAMCHGIEFAGGDVTLTFCSVGAPWRIDLAWKDKFETHWAVDDDEAIKIFVGEIESWYDTGVGTV